MTKLSRLMVATLVLFAASCDKAPPTEVEDASFEQVNASTRDGKSASREDLARVARATALALRDAEVRSRVYADIHASHDPEKKLSLRDYLDGPGLVLRQRMTSSANLTDDQLSSALRRLPPVDLYMPVAEHREIWSGDDQLIVAYQLEDRDIPDGFDLEGGKVMLSLAAPPIHSGARRGPARNARGILQSRDRCGGVYSGDDHM